MKRFFKGTTISKRIFIPIMSLIFFQFAMIIMVFSLSLIGKTLNSSEVDSYKNAVNVSKNYLESMMSNKWSNISTDVDLLTANAKYYCSAKGITVNEMLSNEEYSNEFLLDQSEAIAEIIQRNQVSVAYAVLDSKLTDTEQKSSVFLYSMNPELSKKDSIEVLFSSYSIVQHFYQNGYGVDSNAYTTTYKDLSNKEFFIEAVSEANRTNKATGYWSTGLIVKNNNNVLTYSYPLIVENQVIGVLGIGITARYLANSLAVITKDTSISNYALAMDNKGDKRLVFSNYSDYSIPEVTQMDLRSTKYSEVFTYKKGRIREYIYASSLRVHSDTNYANEFYFYGITPKSEIFATSYTSIRQVVIIFVVGYFLEFLALAAIVFYISNPIKKVSKHIENGEVDTIPKTGIQEVDLLLDNISKYYDAGIELQAENLAAVKANQAKTAFLFSMSHDIRTPMNAIVGFAKLLEKNQYDEKKRMEYIHKIQDSSQVLLSIINNVLEMARIEAGKIDMNRQSFEFKQFADTIESMFAGYVTDKNMQFTVDNKVKHSLITTDEVKLREIYTNILSNAFKYTKDGGSIEVVYEEVEKSETEIQLVITVKDNGIGMSEEFLPHIFDEFSRASNTTMTKIEGTGLGMSIVKKYIDLLGGEISVESKLNVGSTFAFSIPCEVKPIEENLAVSSDYSDIEIKGRRILLAEDNEINAEIAIEILTEEGLFVDRAADGVECIQLLESKAPGYYDVILMDVQMPVMDGYTASKKIRCLENDIKAGIPIIAMTANAFEEDKKDAKNAGMNGHIAKPINVENLFYTLRCIFGGKKDLF